jgi:SynChlorMet cassette protein ScmC
MNPEEPYILDLGHGLRWQLSASSQGQFLLNELARVLGLRTGRNVQWPRLILGFNPQEFGEHYPSERVPPHGWDALEFAGSKIWSHSAAEHLLLDVQLGGDPNDFFRAWSFVIQAIYSRGINVGGIPLHAALVERNGLAVALAGASGRGKSTCCNRIPHPWRVLSDDHTLVLPGRNGNSLAHPFPTWGDVLRGTQVETSCVERKVALSAIFFLEQGPSDEIESIGSAETALKINQSAHEIFGCNVATLEQPQRRHTKARLFENACEISKAVKAHVLRVSLRGRFWDKIDEVLSESMPEK